LEPILVSQAGFLGLPLGSFIGFGVLGGLGFIIYLQHYYPSLAIDRLTFSVFIWAVLAAIIPAGIARFGFEEGWIAVSVPSVAVAVLICLVTYCLGIWSYRPNRDLRRMLGRFSVALAESVPK
jgi:hypothetical protein